MMQDDLAVGELNIVPLRVSLPGEHTQFYNRRLQSMLSLLMMRDRSS